MVIFRIGEVTVARHLPSLIAATFSEIEMGDLRRYAIIATIPVSPLIPELVEDNPINANLSKS
jgi:hypothetical protein